MRSSQIREVDPQGGRTLNKELPPRLILSGAMASSHLCIQLFNSCGSQDKIIIVQFLGITSQTIE
jgi:hypothetical protein